MNKILKALTAIGFAGFAATAIAAELLVDVDWIKQHSCDDGVRVLDIRNGIDGGSRSIYLQGHIPCAVYTDYLKGGWRSKVSNVPGQLSSPQQLAKLTGNLGIDNDTHVVVVHHGKNAVDMGSATRMFWTFKVMGHDNVSILNGGHLAYASDEKNKLEKGNNKPEAKTFNVAMRSEMLITKADVKAAIDDNSIQLVDLRPNHQFVGINRHPKSTRNGTIPSSKNLPESWMTMNGGGTFRAKDELAKLYDLAHVDPFAKQINFCNTGHWASLGWFVSSQIMGNSGATMYDGSMVEWSADAALPMELKVSIE